MRGIFLKVMDPEEDQQLLRLQHHQSKNMYKLRNTADEVCTHCCSYEQHFEDIITGEDLGSRLCVYKDDEHYKSFDTFKTVNTPSKEYPKMLPDSWIKDITQYLDDIIDGHDVVFINAGGSYLTGHQDIYSDGDIGVWVFEDIPLSIHSTKFVECNGKKIHWFYRTIKEMIENSDVLLHQGGTLQARYLDNEKILYVNPQYQKQVDQILSYSKELSALTGYKLLNITKDRVKNYLQQNNILTSLKLFYHLFDWYGFISGNIVPHDFIMKIKRSTYETLSKEDKDTFNQYLEKLYSIEIPETLEQDIQSLNNKIKNLFIE